MRHLSGLRVFDALFVALLLAAFVVAAYLDTIIPSRLVLIAQVSIFVLGATVLVRSALQRGLARGSRLAYIDELTGLNNRRSFTETLARRLCESHDTHEKLALLLLDLDRFKLVNDTLGHPAGDDLLKIVAARFRAFDATGDFVARLGGDEFAVIARVRDGVAVMALADRILRNLNRPALVAGHEIWPNASIGVALADVGRPTPGELLSMADVALYQAKGDGKGRAFLFDAKARLPSITSLSFESELHLAIESGQFEMLYQPIVDLRTNRITGVEALIRWNHPRQGSLSPDAFLAVAEEAGLGQMLGRWIIRQAAAQGRKWRDLLGYDLSISINVTDSEFRSADFSNALASLVEEFRNDPQCLTLEVSETAMTSDAGASSAHHTERLRRLGFKIAIEDFGVGFSLLNYLQANRLDILKLDPAFVRSDDANPRTLRIVRSIVDLAHSLGMVVIAEGVETREQYGRVLEAGCDQAQGYYFARPMRPFQLTDLLLTDGDVLPIVERRTRNRAWGRAPVPAAFTDSPMAERRGA